MGRIRGEVEQIAVIRAGELLAAFLANRKERTSRAYAVDVDEFARFLARPTAAAIAQLLASDSEAAQRLAMEYVIDLRRRRRSQATIDRRLSTLRALVRMAVDRRFVNWTLRLPTVDQISEAELHPVSESEHYLLPRHHGEIDRLDIQHYAFQAVFGANYAAPIARPARVLDVGCGTGQWGFEVCEQFPDALVVGFDLVSGKPRQPPRYRLAKGNLLQGLPFGDDQFDFVHQRYLVLGVPVVSWPAVVADLVRVARPGAWVELAEAPFEMERAGPATERLLNLTRELSGSLGLDTHRTVFDSLDGYLRDTGLERVVRRETTLPIGPWGGEVGSLMATDNRVGWARVCEVLQARSMLSAEEASKLMYEAHEEAQHGRMAWPAVSAFGQKPGR